MKAPPPAASPAVTGFPYQRPGTLCGWDDDARKWNVWTDLDGLCERLSAQARSQLGKTLERPLFDTPTAEQIATCRGTTTAIPCATGIDCPSSECVHSTVELTNALGVTQVVEGPSLCAKTEDELTNCALPLARVLEQTVTDLIGALALKAGAADLVGDGEVKTERIEWVSSGVTGNAAATGAVDCGAATGGNGLKLVWEARRCASP